jgi:hypothetical protein
MLRSLFRGPRSVRLPIQNGPVDVQRVTLAQRSKSSPILSRIFTTIAVTYFVARTINHYYPESAHGSKSTGDTVRPAPKSEERVKAWRDPWDKATNTDPQHDSQVIHLMLPIWIRKKKQEPWRHDDPIWRSFVALDGDKNRLKEITEAIKKPLLKAVLVKYGPTLIQLSAKQKNGQVKMTLRESWNLAPPLYAPPTYEIPCIFVQSNKTTYGWRQVPNSMGAKVDRIFHPIALATAFFYGVREFAWASYLITKARLIDQIESLSTNAKVTRTAQKPLSEDEKVLKQLRVNRLSDKDKGIFLPFLRGEFGEHESRRAYRDFVKSMTYQGAIESACAEFRARWHRGLESSLKSFARGSSVAMVGNIAFVGEKGTLHLHATAVYSPETNSLVGQPIVNHAYVTPNMEKWVEAPESLKWTKETLASFEASKARHQKRNFEEKGGAQGAASRSALKPPPSSQEDESRTQEAVSQEGQEENREK